MNEKDAKLQVISAVHYVGQTMIIVLIMATITGLIVSYPVLNLKEKSDVVKCIVSFILAGLLIGIYHH